MTQKHPTISENQLKEGYDLKLEERAILGESMTGVHNMAGTRMFIIALFAKVRYEKEHNYHQDGNGKWTVDKWTQEQLKWSNYVTCMNMNIFAKQTSEWKPQIVEE